MDQLLILHVNEPADQYFCGTSYWKRAIKDQLPTIAEGVEVDGAKWKKAELKDGHLVSNTTGSAIYGEWREPKAKKVLLHAKWTYMLYVNGHWADVDCWGLGWQWTPLQLKEGVNSILSWSSLAFEFKPVPAPVSFVEESALVPDPKPNEAGPFEGSIVALNCDDIDRSVTLKAQIDDGPITETRTDSIPAMGSRIVRFRFQAPPNLKSGSHTLKAWVYREAVANLPINVPQTTDGFRRTYVSRFDHMVKGYAVRPALKGPKGKPIISFTYGSGPIGAMTEISSFRSKNDFSIVVPEGRTTGNWDGLSRRDALETLDVAVRDLGADKTRAYLYGHSFGGHGAYQMAALNPDAFAGLGTSAGWLSVFSYLPDDYPRHDENDPIDHVFSVAQSEIDLEKRLDDLARIRNVAIVHGDKDESVPLKGQTLRIRDELVKRGADVSLFILPGLHHFWERPDGSNQFDFPPLFKKLMSSPRRGTGRFFDQPELPHPWIECFSKPFVAVYGTHGSPPETKAAKERAEMEVDYARVMFRLDARVEPDTVPLRSLRGWNVELYGNATSNALWKDHPSAEAVLKRAEGKGIHPKAWLIQANRGSDLWSAIGGIDLPNCRLAYYVRPWEYDLHFPQWTLFDETVLDKGIKGVAAAGFNGGPEGWRLPPSQPR